MNSVGVGLVCGVGLWLSTATASAAEVWTGDFETGDLTQWSFVLNPEINGTDYAFAQADLVAEGMFAGRLELHNDAVWPNGLKRVELQHRPADERTAEGATTWFAWSFYLPEALTVDPDQQIAYWEANASFQQVMTFQVQGEDITFITRFPNFVEQWQGAGLLTAGQWHRIAMGVTWSTDPGQGAVDVWFDGTQVVDQAAAATRADANPLFVQLGLLRGQVEFEDVPVIIIDDAVEGDTVEDVRPGDLPGAGGDSSSGGGQDSSGGVADDTTGAGPGDGTEASGPAQTSGATQTSDPTTGTAGDAGAGGGDADGCGCRSSRQSAGAAGLGLLLLLLGRRRRRASHRRS